MSVFQNQSHANAFVNIFVPQGQTGNTGPTGPRGPFGPSLHLKGEVANFASLPVGASFADAYITLDTGDCYVWLGSSWTNAGQFDGPTGLAGPVGPLGPTGPTGIAGNQGPAGIFGPAGDTGPTGTTGIQGPLGQTGPIGFAGIQGPTGPTGTIDGIALQSNITPDVAQNLPFPAVWNTYASFPISSDIVNCDNILVTLPPIFLVGDNDSTTTYQPAMLYKITGHNYSTGGTTRWLSTVGSYVNGNVPTLYDSIVLTKNVDYDATTTQMDFQVQIGVNAYNDQTGFLMPPNYTGQPATSYFTFLGLS
jgi:hypothetical protein